MWIIHHGKVVFWVYMYMYMYYVLVSEMVLYLWIYNDSELYKDSSGDDNNSDRWH